MYDILKQRYWALLRTAIQSRKDPRLVLLENNEARIVFDNNRLLVILLDEQPKEVVALQNWARVLLEENTIREIDIVVLAAGPQIDRTLEEADFETPWTTRLAVFTLNEAGVYHEITKKRSDNFLQSLLEKSLTQTLSDSTLAQAKLEVKTFLEKNTQEATELLKFQRELRDHGSFAMYLLLIIIAAFYLAQEWLGGSDYQPALLRMGADSASLVRGGEYWRLLTSIFLHGSFIHVAANSYVLFALGNFFNKLIGNTRFVTLFFFSGLMGSLASVFIGGSELSVGASGGLWGLFGLSAALVVRPTHFLPDKVRQGLRKVTVINLVLNIGISFLPMIDIWAHLGGGIAGFALGLIYAYQGEHPRHNFIHTLTATFASLLVIVSLGANLYKEQPWLLVSPIQLSVRSIEKGELVIGIPTILRRVTESRKQIVFGQFPYDPYTITINSEVINSPLLDNESAGRFLAETLSRELEIPLGQISVRGINNFPTAFAYTETPNKVKLLVWLQLRGTKTISVLVIAPSRTPQRLLQNLEKIIESLETAVGV